MLEMPGVIASYWRDGDRYRLFGTNAMTGTEKAWWKQHGQELVDCMAAANGPDLIGLLHDRVELRRVRRSRRRAAVRPAVPMVFWSPSLAFENDTGAPFKTIDVMPTILDVDGDPADRADGRDRSAAGLNAWSSPRPAASLTPRPSRLG